MLIAICLALAPLSHFCGISLLLAFCTMLLAISQLTKIRITKLWKVVEPEIYIQPGLPFLLPNQRFLLPPVKTNGL